ncbi:ATP-binding cassette domain-containing protein, partial [Candidatus Falkowbacteria bacterium]|nr:ATP-binding cassette domain-containing protein [Candidatus Falkowbacteria bacterium]
LLNTLTAMQNVQIPMMFQGVSEDKRIKRAEMLLTRVGLGERRFHKPTELSGGEMQRVAIARALANDPEVILADEPTGNLDSKTGKEVMQLLIDLHKKEKRTIIMVTHDKNVANLAERQIFLKDGQVVKGGK